MSYRMISTRPKVRSVNIEFELNSDLKSMDWDTDCMSGLNYSLRAGLIVCTAHIGLSSASWQHLPRCLCPRNCREQVCPSVSFTVHGHYDIDDAYSPCLPPSTLAIYIGLQTLSVSLCRGLCECVCVAV